MKPMTRAILTRPIRMSMLTITAVGVSAMFAASVALAAPPGNSGHPQEYTSHAAGEECRELGPSVPYSLFLPGVDLCPSDDRPYPADGDCNLSLRYGYSLSSGDCVAYGDRHPLPVAEPQYQHSATGPGLSNQELRHYYYRYPCLRYQGIACEGRTVEEVTISPASYDEYRHGERLFPLPEASPGR